VEGFVRQVIGWREYVWGTYWHFADQWPSDNALDADTPLPEAFWTGETDMNCIRDAVGGLRETAHAHHIQRLMLFGNLTMLLGVRPREAFDWFHESYNDGFEWVMAPNVLAMATFADGGRCSPSPTRPAGDTWTACQISARGCRYDPSKRTGDDACPFSTLYWDFLDRHRPELGAVHRMKMPYRTLERMDEGELAQIRLR